MGLDKNTHMHTPENPQRTSVLISCLLLIFCMVSPCAAQPLVSQSRDAVALPPTASPALTGPAQDSATALPFPQMYRTPVARHGLEPSPLLLALHGRKVSLHGYMVAQEVQPADRFWLSPRPLRMSEHADGEANDLPLNVVLVFLPASEHAHPMRHIDAPIRVEGTLHWGRQEMPDGHVSWLRLQLDPSPAQP
jgi:hypothetical protein